MNVSERQLQDPLPRIVDPTRLKANIFVRRRRLHAHRIYLRSLARLRGIETPPTRPIFVLGAPRSGTTLLFRLLRRHEDLRALRGEGHVLWSTYQHPRDKGWASDRATASDIRAGEARYIYTAISRIAGDGRFLDKTPRNCLRVPYLNALFPDAVFVLLKRDGRATVSSLIEGWKVRHGVSYRLPRDLQLAEYHGKLWSYVLPPGWEERADTSIADIAAHQFVSSYETALDDLADLPADKVVGISFEDLLARPIETTAALLRDLDLPPSTTVMEMASDLGSHQVQTNSPPRPDKWKDRGHEIDRVWYTMEPTMRRLGYDIARAG